MYDEILNVVSLLEFSSVFYHFQILISIVINWLICGILTYFDVITDDCNDIGFRARTDARLDVIRDNPWFNIPYPGKHGIIQKALLLCC